jgi:hypothetical protein
MGHFSGIGSLMKKNLVLFTIAASLCAAFWAWACHRAIHIDSLLPQDSRVGIILILCVPSLPMAGMSLLNVARILLRIRARRIRLSPFFLAPVITWNLFLTLAVLERFSKVLV